MLKWKKIDYVELYRKIYWYLVLQTDKKTDIQMCWPKERETDSKTDRQTERQTDNQIDIQTDRQTDR